MTVSRNFLSSSFNQLPRWLKISLLLGLLSIFNYLPAFDQDYDPFAAYQRGNLSSTLSGILHISLYPGWPGEDDYNFYWEWVTAKQLMRGEPGNPWHYWDQGLKSQFQFGEVKPQVSLWRWDDRDGGRPLLTLSDTPILYPLSVLYYFTPNLTPFAAFHFWLGLLGGFLLSTRLPLKVRRFGRPVLLLLVIIILPELRLDFEAAAAWWLVGLWLSITNPPYVKIAGLTLIFSMIWLSVGLPTSILLISSLSISLMLVQGRRWRLSSVFRVMLQGGVAVLLGLLLAAPQVFPRWFDRMQS